MSTVPALSITDLSYTYTNEWTRRKIPALQNINLEVLPGESFGFLGANGAGKTTTIKCVLNLIRPQSGQVLINGRPSSNTDARRQIGYLAEQPYFYDNLTVAELMGMYASLIGMSGEQRKKAAQETLERVALSERSKSPIRTLSKGLLQRLALAQAILGQPCLLILDEPFSGLDPLGRKDFRELLCALKQAGTTIFMSSHILSDVEFLCDRVSIMAHGQIKGVFSLDSLPQLASGVFELVVHRTERITPALAGLYQDMKPEDRFIRFSFKDKESAHKALQLALEQQASIESFEFVQGGLEDLFVRLVKEGPQS